MATRQEVEWFFKGTGISVDEVVQGKDGFLHLTRDHQALVISSDVGANKQGDVNQPKLILQYSKR